MVRQMQILGKNALRLHRSTADDADEADVIGGVFQACGAANPQQKLVFICLIGVICG
jgi:hypothetical protein